MQKTEQLLDPSGQWSTGRKDNWWTIPVTMFLGILVFVVYATFRTFYPVFAGAENLGIMHDGTLLSPFFAPLFFANGEMASHALFGEFPSWWPTFLSSPAIAILWAPLGFRLTCYYARKAYYRAIFLDPQACAVGEGGEEYHGEKRFLIFQNLHRYFFYLAFLFVFILWYDAIKACFGWEHWSNFQITIGSVVLILDAYLITGYTFGCHSFRYLIGGKKRCFSCPKSSGEQEVSSRYNLWKIVSRLNDNHNVWFWASLFMVGVTDFYIWMVDANVFTDIVIID